ncbi:plasmid mobilization protein [Streptomyces sp. NPDC001380]|uniref:plasmid mobilization protein n=1 Tax=Streptomyces sp. NPDC001380 TaxID=3364566 RepID=UPI0036A8AA10
MNHDRHAHQPGADHRTTPADDRTDPRPHGGASKCARPSYGRSCADASAQGGGGEPAVPRARAHAAPPDLRHQGVPQEEQPIPDPSAAQTPAAARAGHHRTPKRRPRDPQNLKTVKRTARFDPSEDAEIRRRATALGISVASYIARKALADDAAPLTTRDERLDAAIDEAAALRSQIARLGNNVNQLTRAYNSGATLPPGPVRDALTAGRALLSDARALLTALDETAMRLAKRRNR